jgi:hypothetical protein
LAFVTRHPHALRVRASLPFIHPHVVFVAEIERRSLRAGSPNQFVALPNALNHALAAWRPLRAVDAPRESRAVYYAALRVRQVVVAHEASLLDALQRVIPLQPTVSASATRLGK